MPKITRHTNRYIFCISIKISRITNSFQQAVVLRFPPSSNLVGALGGTYIWPIFSESKKNCIRCNIILNTIAVYGSAWNSIRTARAWQACRKSRVNHTYDIILVTAKAPYNGNRSTSTDFSVIKDYYPLWGDWNIRDVLVVQDCCYFPLWADIRLIIRFSALTTHNVYTYKYTYHGLAIKDTRECEYEYTTQCGVGYRVIHTRDILYVL